MKLVWFVISVFLCGFVCAEESDAGKKTPADSMEVNKIESEKEEVSESESKVVTDAENLEMISDNIRTEPFTICGDKKYLSLKMKSLDKMTEREFQYFMQRDKFCCDSLLKDERTEFVIKEESSGIYKARNIFLIIGSLFTYTVSTMTLIRLSRD